MKFHVSTTLDKKTAPIILIPGWATDPRIFDRQPIAASTIAAHGQFDGCFSKDLADFLTAEGIASVTLFGWSLGGAAALTFARAYPEMVRRVALAGVRPSYSDAEIADMQLRLSADKEACLFDFYRRCFLPAQRDDYRWFKTTLQSAYLEKWTTEELLRGLDYLRETSFGEAALRLVPTTVFHGALDIVAPVDEIASIAERAGVDVRVVPNASHAVIMDPRCSMEALGFE